MQKLNRYFMEGQNTDSVWKDAAKLVEFIWFSLCFHFARCGREGWGELTRHWSRYVTEKLTEETKNTKEALNNLSSHTQMFVCTKPQLHLIQWLRFNFNSARLILTARHCFRLQRKLPPKI